VAVFKVSRSRRGTKPHERLSVSAEIDDSRILRSSEVQAGGCGHEKKGRGVGDVTERWCGPSLKSGGCCREGRSVRFAE
jgi:hypothetical protein